MNNAIGKWISTTCCACFAEMADLKSKGFSIFLRSFSRGRERWFAAWPYWSLHYDLAGHLWVNRAEVRIGSGSGESERKFLVRVENFRLEYFGIICADHGVRNIVAVRPGDCGSHGNGQSCRTEAEIIDLHFCSFCFLLRGHAGVPRARAQCPDSQNCNRNENCKRHTSPHDFSSSPYLFSKSLGLGMCGRLVIPGSNRPSPALAAPSRRSRP